MNCFKQINSYYYYDFYIVLQSIDTIVDSIQ